jgi:hypothetical protein
MGRSLNLAHSMAAKVAYNTSAQSDALTRAAGFSR